MSDTSMWGPSNSAVTLNQTMQLNNLAMQQSQANIQDTQAQVVQRQQANQAEKLKQQQQLSQQEAMQKIAADTSLKDYEAKATAADLAQQPVLAEHYRELGSKIREKNALASKNEAEAAEKQTKNALEATEYASGLIAQLPLTPEGKAKRDEIVNAAVQHGSLSPEVGKMITDMPHNKQTVEGLQSVGMKHIDELRLKREAIRDKEQFKLWEAQAAHARSQAAAEAAKRKVEEQLLAANTKNGGENAKVASSNLTGDEFLKTLNPFDQREVLAVDGGDIALSKFRNRPRKGELSTPYDDMKRKVLQYNPNFSEATAAETKKARMNFDTGPQGDKIRNIVVANNHLALLAPIHDALKLGNVQLANKLKAAYEAQTGEAAPASYDAAAQIIAAESVSAIVSGKGGVSERKAAEEHIKKELSNGQASAVVKTYQDLYTGQLMGLRGQFLSSIKRAKPEQFEAKLSGPTVDQYKAAVSKQEAHSEDSMAVTWAKAHPDDPRSKKILESNHGF